MLAIFWLWGCTAWAAVTLEAQGEAGLLEGAKLFQSMRVVAGGTSYELGAVGAGLRYKKVIFVKASVYVGQLFAGSAKEFRKDAALDSVAAAPATAMRMTFLRDVDGETLGRAFADAFKENKVETGSGPVKVFLDDVRLAGGVKDKSVITVAGWRSGKAERVAIQGPDGKILEVEGAPGFIRAIFSLWLGKPSDSGVESLQKDILK